MNTSILTRSPLHFFTWPLWARKKKKKSLILFFSGWDVERAILGGSWPGSQGSNQNENKMDVD
jgi:hypothetical protein